MKVYLDCGLDERTRRRRLELSSSGVTATRTGVARNLAKRDRIDSGRAMSPLKRVRDAVLVDTTWLSIAEQVSIICSLARRRFGIA